MATATPKISPEPRWPAFVAMLAAGGVYLALPERLSVGPGWGLLAIILVLMIPIAVSNHRGDFHITRPLIIIANGAITVGMIASLAWLIEGIPHHRDSPMALLRGALALWFTNIVVFALWYWKLDAGGPSGRDARTGRPESSFLFPQMLDEEGEIPGRRNSWTTCFSRLIPARHFRRRIRRCFLGGRKRA